MSDTDILARRILKRLQTDHEYIQRVPSTDLPLIKLIRSTGRRVCREKGWPVRTFASETNAEGNTVVGILRQDPLTAEELNQADEMLD